MKKIHLACWDAQFMEIFSILFKNIPQFAKILIQIQPGQPIFEFKKQSYQVAFN